MMKRFKLLFLMSGAFVVGVSNNAAMAAAYQLWEQDGASVGNYHAGRAAEAADASTSYYNPAGLVRIHNQEMVLGLDPILTDFKFRGTVEVFTANVPHTSGPQGVNAQGGNFNLVPDFHYAAPLTDSNNLVFGLSVVAPFGLKTNYSSNTFARYDATMTSLQVIDVAPSIGFALNDKISFGAGLDAEHARAEFDLVAGGPDLENIFGENVDTNSQNVGNAYGYGYHLGTLFQLSEKTRIGLTYHSKVTFRLHGDSKFTGPLANDGVGGLQESTHLSTATTLPPTTTLSVFHTINPTWDVMGTIAYTQWSVLNNITLNNVAGIVNLASTNTLTVVVPEGYRNTWNYSVGGNYHLNEQWLFRAGLGYDETPSNNTDRNLQLPDSDRIAVALGTHYQYSKAWSFDIGWTHFFAKSTNINHLSQVVGDQTTLTNGSVNASADVFGFQAKWDIA